MEFTFQCFNKLFGAGLPLTLALILSSCGGGGSSSTSATPATNTSTSRAAAGTLIIPPVASGNVLPIVVDAGPLPLTNPAINVAYVTVTICVPGTTPNQAGCQTIDHVQLDTGSTGLRLLNSAIYSNLNLPQVSDSAGRIIGECTSFAIGTTWGSVRLADIYLGGEMAKSVPIQEIGDQPGGATAVPADCSSTGKIQDTQALLGSNGILGVGIEANDCPACLTQFVPASYYSCSATGCTNSTVTAAQIVTNPVSLLPADNNGVVVTLPAVANAGATNLSGSLIFGIGTQANNGLNGATVLQINANGIFNTTFNSVTLPSYIDSGSNALFFNDAAIPKCTVSTWVYCPASSPLPLSASVYSSTAPTVPIPLSLSIVNGDQLGNSVIAASIGGPSTTTGSGSFAFGLPFFYGKTVYTAISGMPTAGGPTGPYFAYR